MITLPLRDQSGAVVTPAPQLLALEEYARPRTTETTTGPAAFDRWLRGTARGQTLTGTPVRPYG